MTDSPAVVHIPADGVMLEGPLGVPPAASGVYFGASTGAAAALIAAADEREVAAVVSRGGRPDLADRALPRVQAPTPLIVGGDDVPVIAMNEDALRRLGCEKRLAIVPGATHLFEEPGTLEAVVRLATDWFRSHLGAGTRAA
jgi:putative phosphoribosyl transferase